MNFAIACLISTGIYASFSTFLYHAKFIGFSPQTLRGDGKKQSPTAHRHAAYKLMVLPFVEIYPTYLAFSKFDFSLRKVIEHLLNMASDPLVAKEALLRPLDGNGSLVLELYRVSFFLGVFHYWYQQPFNVDRIYHKVFATILSFTNFYLNDAGGVFYICILLWKPAGTFESIFTLLYLKGSHKTTLGKAYVAFCSAFVFIERWVFESILLFALLRALVSFPGELLFDCWQRPFIHICFTGLTLLHLKWAYRSLQTLPDYLFREGAHGLRFAGTDAEYKKTDQLQKLT